MQQTRPRPEPISPLEVIDLGRLEYAEALALQKRFHEERVLDLTRDRLVLVEHPPVITLGLSGGGTDLLVSRESLARRGVAVVQTERGGKATFHAPGQLVAYPILRLRHHNLHDYVAGMLEVVAAVLRAHGLRPELGLHGPGVWVGGAKIASIGMAVRKWVTFHGIAFNVNMDLDWFSTITPCGHPGERMTSLARELGQAVDMAAVRAQYVREFCRIFGYGPPDRPRRTVPRLPAWLRAPLARPAALGSLTRLLDRLHLETVCQQAHCPNLGECCNRGTATFMILGAVCTRACRYCAVDKGRPAPPDAAEPQHVAQAVATLRLRHAVVTSVTRDDLPDGGADHFARTVAAIRERCPGVTVEVLVPDFAGDGPALERVLAARPDVFNHNLETVPRLFPDIRPRADFARSLAILARAAALGLATKSGLMLGLGETNEELLAALQALRQAGCSFLTLGQYLAPSTAHAPVRRFVRPSEFEALARQARALGFADVAAGPLVRSSYRAEAMLGSGDETAGTGRVAG